MNEQLPAQNRPLPAKDQPELQESPLDNFTGHSQVPEDIMPSTGAPEDQGEKQFETEVSPDETSLSGLSRVVAQIRLRNTERRLKNAGQELRVAQKKSERGREKAAKNKRAPSFRDDKLTEHKLSGFEAWRSEARKARMGRLGVRRIGLVTTYGKRDGGRLFRDRATVPNESSYFSANKKLNRVEGTMDHLLIHGPTREARVEALTERRDTLRDRLGYEKPTPPKKRTEAGHITLHSQYVRVLDLAKTGAPIEAHELVDQLDDTYTNDPFKMGVLLRKLERDGVMDKYGTVLLSADEIDKLTATPLREREERTFAPTDPIVGQKEYISDDLSAGNRSESIPNFALLREFQITTDDIAELTNLINEQLKKASKEYTEETGQRLTETERAELESDIQDEVVREAFADDSEEEAIQATKQAVIILQRGARSSGRRPGKRDIDNAMRTLQQAGMLDDESGPRKGRESRRNGDPDKSGAPEKALSDDEDEAYEATIRMLAGGLKKNGGTPYSRLSFVSLENTLKEKGYSSRAASVVYRELQEKGHISMTHDKDKGFEVFTPQEEFQRILNQIENS